MLPRHQLQDPVLLLRLLYPTHDGPYKAAHMAVDLKKVLDEYGLPLSRIACVMGDNVTFNASLAKTLGLPLGKCLPHSLNLVARAALAPSKACTRGAWC